MPSRSAWTGAVRGSRCRGSGSSGVLEAARRPSADGRGPVAAQVTAALARQLQHSVPADRPRARPLAEEAVAIARDLDDAATLASCLLAQHDSLWTPGTAVRRVEIAREITALTRATGDREAPGAGAAAHGERPAGERLAGVPRHLREYAAVTRDLRQPRHDYLLRTREAALALLDGDIDAGDRLSAEAAELGEAVGDTDTGNVRMSQRLEVARARGDADELREMAARAVEWWVGAPAHAHAIAAGFLARAGDLEGARRELDTVLSLRRTGGPTGPTCGRCSSASSPPRRSPWATTTCAAGCSTTCARCGDAARSTARWSASWAPTPTGSGCCTRRSGTGSRRAACSPRRCAVHERLGARGLGGRDAPRALARLDEGGVALRQAGEVWEVGYRGRSATVRDSKGVRDLAVLVGRPGVDVPALELAGG